MLKIPFIGFPTWRLRCYKSGRNPEILQMSQVHSMICMAKHQGSLKKAIISGLRNVMLSYNLPEPCFKQNKNKKPEFLHREKTCMSGIISLDMILKYGTGVWVVSVYPQLKTFTFGLIWILKK